MNKIVLFRLTSLALLTVFFLSETASAQFDEIIVTATKRATTLQDAPLAISITTEADIEQLQINDVLALQNSVPSLKINQQQFANQNTFLIRGFGNGANNPGVEPAVAISIDGVMISRNQSALGNYFDIERVEVLKGPQSTLFGKNSSAGVISVTTKKPENEFGGRIEVTGGDYGLVKLQGSVTGPLSDKTSFRISASSMTRDGYTDNLLLGTEINDRDRLAVRGQILSEVSDELTLRFIADYDEADEKCCTATHTQHGPIALGLNQISSARQGVTTSIVNPADPYSYNVYLNQDPVADLENYGFSLHAELDMGGMIFKSITSYRESDHFVFGDVDFGGYDVIDNGITDEFETFTQEFRLESDTDGPMSWLVGAFYQDESIDHDRNVIYRTDAYTTFDLLLQGSNTSLAAVAGGVGAGAVATLSNLSAANQALSGALPAGVTLAVPVTATQVGALLQGVPTGNGAAVDALYAQVAQGIITATQASFFAPGTGLQNELFTMENEAISLFAEINYDVTDALTISVAGAYNDDAKDLTANVTTDDAFAAVPFFLNPATRSLSALQIFPPFPNYPSSTEDGSFSSDDITHSFKAIYDLNDDTTVYVSHSTGFKASSVSMSSNVAVPPGAPFSSERYSARPEDVENIEFGYKRTFDNGFLNLVLFQQSVKDLQDNTFVGTGFILGNVEEQTHEGIEIDSLFYLTEDLVTTLSASYIDAVFTEWSAGPCDAVGLPPASDNCPLRDPNDPTLGRQTSISFTGLTPAGVPELAITASATYNFDVTDSIGGFVRAEFVYEDEIQATNNVPSEIVSRKVETLNASIGISDENLGWNVLIYGRNITEDEYPQTSFPVPGISGQYALYPNEPRMFGISIGKKF
ncbi:MAG TPA: hypothetical protein DGQ22_01050 [Rhodobiaceae bacterium]|nr:hypothetical protein [Rhodobiaceae bacterium]